MGKIEKITLVSPKKKQTVNVNACDKDFWLKKGYKLADGKEVKEAKAEK